MPLDVFLALLSFSFVSSMTPGPNNFMLFASGVNFGFRRTIPHMFGIAFGFGVLLACVGFGLGQVLERFPGMFLAIKILGAIYMIYLAWRIATSGPLQQKAGGAHPMSFLAAALFQWVNPKAWVMAVVAMATYTAQGDFTTNVLIVVFAFCFVNFPSVSVWAGFGTGMQRFLSNPTVLTWFNRFMALALIISLWPMLR